MKKNGMYDLDDLKKGAISDRIFKKEFKQHSFERVKRSIIQRDEYIPYYSQSQLSDT